LEIDPEQDAAWWAWWHDWAEQHPGAVSVDAADAAFAAGVRYGRSTNERDDD
jgi:hypothetical protein